jgi:serine O-acetyltransferase
MLLHANYIQIGKHVTIGKQCILAQQNAIGPSYTMQDATLADTQSARGPIIGDHVLFGVGSAAFGSIRIGNYTKIGINTAVEKDFPDHAILIGVPAKNVNLG